MTLVLDTNVLSALIARRPVAEIEMRINDSKEELITTSITIGELYFGAYRLGDGGQRLLREIETLIVPRFRALAFDAKAAQVFGRLSADLRRMGTPIGDADTRIAAIALTHDLTVVTANVRHFERVPGLRVENWIEA